MVVWVDKLSICASSSWPPSTLTSLRTVIKSSSTSSNCLPIYSRFGCLSRAAAVLVYNYDHMSEFLSQNPHINNRLACLVIEVIAFPYLKVILVVFACLGVHLVEPFYARTIERDATHTKLRDFYKCLHTSLVKPITEDYTKFTKPEFPSVSKGLFTAVKKNYKAEVLDSVSGLVKGYMKEVVRLSNLMLPHLQTVLARQRRDYGLDEEAFPMEYQVSEKTLNIDQIPVHNIGMERQCGLVDFRLRKLGNLTAVSRSIFLQRSQQLKTGRIPSFRGFREAAQAKRELELSG